MAVAQELARDERNRVIFPYDDEWEPGTWFLTFGERMPLIICPFCGGGLLGNDAPHEVLENGDVNASVVCGHPNCTFHDFIALKDWTYGHVPHLYLRRETN